MNLNGHVSPSGLIIFYPALFNLAARKISYLGPRSRAWNTIYLADIPKAEAGWLDQAGYLSAASGPWRRLAFKPGPGDSSFLVVFDRKARSLVLFVNGDRIGYVDANTLAEAERSGYPHGQPEHRTQRMAVRK